jgi:AbrB family looped-hinge helix DNA binding protein
MKPALDAAGRVAIPKAIQRQAGLQPGMPLEMRCRDGLIEIEPAPLPVKFVKRGSLLTAVPQKTVRPLRADVVDRTRQSLRRRHVTGS